VARRKTKSSNDAPGFTLALLVFLGVIVAAGSGKVALGLLLAGVLLAGVWLWWRSGGPRTPTAQELAARFRAVGAMSGAHFEIFMADLFRAMGHQASVLGGSGDQGVDIIVGYQGHHVAVQCKNYRRAVGNKPVQEVFAGARHHRCTQAWVVAPAGYTKGAVELARSTGVRLFDANSIRKWISKVDAVEKERERAANLAANDQAIREARKRPIWHPHPDDPPQD
jgi:restriction system protein